MNRVGTGGFRLQIKQRLIGKQEFSVKLAMARLVLKNIFSVAISCLHCEEGGKVHLACTPLAGCFIMQPCLSQLENFKVFKIVTRGRFTSRWTSVADHTINIFPFVRPLSAPVVRIPKNVERQVVQ